MSSYFNYIVEAKYSDGTWKLISKRPQWKQGRIRDMFSANSFEERPFEKRGLPKDCTAKVNSFAQSKNSYGQSWATLAEISQLGDFHYGRLHNELNAFCHYNEYEICRGLLKDKSFDDLERKDVNAILEDEFSAFNDYVNLHSFFHEILGQVYQSDLSCNEEGFHLETENIRIIYWFD